MVFEIHGRTVIEFTSKVVERLTATALAYYQGQGTNVADDV
jgi:hypothetical protein